MAINEKQLYKRINLTNADTSRESLTSRNYRGLSTVNPSSNTTALYDLALIKQDIINHLHIRQGEKLENPEFGTIVWDLLHEPLTDQLKDLLIENVQQVINYDPRVNVDQVIIETYETGIQIECEITYLEYNVVESMRFAFDEENGITQG